jgi:hypothetical protein
MMSGFYLKDCFQQLLRFLTGLLVAGCLVLISGCGDEESPLGLVDGSVQGVWEGTLNLSSTDSVSTEQSEVIRLELVQRDFAFDGYLLRFDPFSLGLSGQSVDTLLVKSGSLSANFVSFQAVDNAAGMAFFEGNLKGQWLEGSIIGENYSGTWSVKYLFLGE